MYIHVFVFLHVFSDHILYVLLLFFGLIQILLDKARLIKRTQLKRTPYRVLGKSEDDEQNPESKEVHLWLVYLSYF